MNKKIDKILPYVLLFTCAFAIYVGSAWVGKNIPHPPFGVVNVG